MPTIRPGYFLAMVAAAWESISATFCSYAGPRMPAPTIFRNASTRVFERSMICALKSSKFFQPEQPASATYWALVAFKPSATLLEESSTAAGQEKLAEFQNTIYAFSWKAGPVWTLLGEVDTGTCPGVVPAPVLKIWGMCGL